MAIPIRACGMSPKILLKVISTILASAIVKVTEVMVMANGMMAPNLDFKNKIRIRPMVRNIIGNRTTKSRRATFLYACLTPIPPDK